MYEFVQKLAKKKKKESWDFNPGSIEWFYLGRDAP